MGNDIGNAISMLVEAGEALKKNSGVHGDTEKSFQMVADMWSAYLHNVLLKRNNGIRVESYDVARMLEMLKIGRSTFGDPFHRDNFIDSAGYAAIAGMLQHVDRPFNPPKEEKQEDGKSVP